MKVARLVRIACSTITAMTTLVATLRAQQSDTRGVITGVVVSGSDEQTLVAGTEVILRAGDDTGFLPIGLTTADADGRFRFEDLPIQGGLIYLPGANRDGIHYPGPRVLLEAQRPSRDVRITVYDTIEAPSPLTAARHHIAVRAEVGVLRVTESIVVANRSRKSYVGQKTSDDQPPITLRLHVPVDFAKVTFDQEFFGRQFRLVNQALETDIPWTPGDREVSFTYLLPLEQSHGIWQRPLDLPCSDVRVSVSRDAIKRVSCNLPTLISEPGGEVVFQAKGTALPQGHMISLELGGLPVPFMAWGRWIASAVLAAMVLGTVVVSRLVDTKGS